MEHLQIVPLAVFFCVTYAFTYLVRAVVDARTRTLMMRGGMSEELLRSLIAAERERQRYAALRWGVALIAAAAGFAIISLSGSRELGPGTIAVLAGAVGLGQIAFFLIASKKDRSNLLPGPPA